MRLLEERGFNVVGQAGDADDLMRKVSAHKPDVAVIDIRMPPTHTDDGVKAAREIGRRHPETAVLVLSQYVDHDYAMRVLGEGTSGVGYLLKDRVAEVEPFAVRSGGSPQEAPPSIRRCSSSSWPRARTTRSKG